MAAAEDLMNVLRVPGDVYDGTPDLDRRTQFAAYVALQTGGQYSMQDVDRILGFTQQVLGGLEGDQVGQALAAEYVGTCVDNLTGGIVTIVGPGQEA